VRTQHRALGRDQGLTWERCTGAAGRAEVAFPVAARWVHATRHLSHVPIQAVTARACDRTRNFIRHTLTSHELSFAPEQCDPPRGRYQTERRSLDQLLYRVGQIRLGQWTSAALARAQISDLQMLPFPAPEEQFDPYRSFHHCEGINTLNDDVLLVVFNLYRLDNELNWNTRLAWCNLSQVCRRWRHLVYGSAFHLGMQILCTNGTPLVDTLVHLPPLPLVVDYQYPTATIMGAQDEPGIFHALQLRDRLRRVVLHIPPSILDRLLFLMEVEEPFPVLSHLSLSSSAEEGTTLLLSKTLLAPNLRHLTLLGIGLPKKLMFLSSTVSLVTLTLTNILDFGYFLPQHLIARLRSLSQLEELSIGFSVPLPRPSAEDELSQDMEATVTLPLLKRLTFRGVSVYFDNLVAQMRAPLLEQLSITLFNQLHFALPHLSHFTNTAEGLRLPIANIIFKDDAVSILMDEREQQLGGGLSSFNLHVMCRQFDWQIDSAAQICSALVATLSGVEQLSFEYEGQGVSAEWQDNAADAVTWHELLGPFKGARKLRIGRALSWELSCALQGDEMGSDPGLLPILEELAAELEEEDADNAFMSFIEARQAAGRPVLLSVPRKRSVPREQFPPLSGMHTVASWFAAWRSYDDLCLYK
jgi:hypothetical protein